MTLPQAAINRWNEHLPVMLADLAKHSLALSAWLAAPPMTRHDWARVLRLPMPDTYLATIRRESEGGDQRKRRYNGQLLVSYYSLVISPDMPPVFAYTRSTIAEMMMLTRGYEHTCRGDWHMAVLQHFGLADVVRTGQKPE